MQTNVDDGGHGARATLRNLISEFEALLAAMGEKGTQRYCGCGCRSAAADEACRR